MNAKRRNRYGGAATRAAQRASALIIALIFLLLLTLLGTTAMRSTSMQERMAGNTRDWNLAFQAAEAALRQAENWLLTTTPLPAFNDTNGFYRINSATRPVWTAIPPTNGTGYVTYAGTLPDVGQQPRYYIEELSTVRPAGTETEAGTPLDEVFFYRVTAVGYGAAMTGGAPVASVVLSTVFRSR